MVFYLIHCSVVWRLKLVLEVKQKRQVSKGSRDQARVSDLSSETMSMAADRQKIGSVGDRKQDRRVVAYMKGREQW